MSNKVGSPCRNLVEPGVYLPLKLSELVDGRLAKISGRHAFATLCTWPAVKQFLKELKLLAVLVDVVDVVPAALSLKIDPAARYRNSVVCDQARLIVS